MSAQEHNAPNDRWYLVDLTHPRANALRVAAADRHSRGAPGCLLGLNINFAGDRGVLKVRNGRGWANPESTPILTTHDWSQLGVLQALVRTRLWVEGVP